MPPASNVRAPLAVARTAWAILLCAGSLVSLEACASRPAADASTSRSDSLAGSRSASAIEKLRRLAADQATHPDALVMKTQAPAGMLLEFAAHPERRDVPLREAMLRLRGPATSGHETRTPVSEGATLEASRRYVAGHALLLANQPTKAIAEFEAGLKADPESTELLADLGAAQAAMGSRAAAAATYRRALSLGLSDARVAAFLGRESLRARRFETAAAELIRADELGATRAADEPSLARWVARADLADAMTNLGYGRAAADLLTEVLSTLPSPGAARLRPEEAELIRRRADLWQRAGDLHASCGSMEEAAAAYKAAASLPGGDTRELSQRRRFAMLGQGHSAQAALDLITELYSPTARSAASHLDLLAALIANSEVSAPLLEATTWLACDSGLSLTATARLELITVATRAAQPARARAAMRTFLVYTPDVTRGVPHYCALHRGDLDAMTRAVAELCLAHPESSQGIARALVLHGDDLPASLAWCESHASEAGASILKAWIAPTDPGTPAALVEPDLAAALGAMTRARRGEWTAAQACLERLSDRAAPSLRAAAMAAMQRYDAALAASEATTTTTTPISNLAKASWLLELGRNAEAEAALLAAREADPLDERPHEALITLYAPKAPLADDGKLAAAARSLREAVPESRFAKGVVARDAAARTQWSQAVTTLLSMLSEEEENPSVITMLAAVAERSARQDASIARTIIAELDARLAKRPDAPLLLAAKARVMAARDPSQARDAETMLETAMTRYPHPELARLRETIVRDALKDPARADALMKRRLASAGRDIDDSIDYAALLLHLGEYEAAGQAIESGLPSNIPLTRQQSARLLQLATDIKAEQLIDAKPGAAAAALVLFDQAAARGLEMTPAMHLSRLLLLCAGHSDDPSRVMKALAETQTHLPEFRDQLPARVAQLLLSKPDPTDCVRFLIEYVNRTTPYADQYAYELFRIAITRGDEADLDECVRRVADPAAMLRSLASTLDNEEVHQEGDEATLRAEVAYWLGNGASVEGREAQAEHAYRLALTLHPGHAWTLNNLGYNLLERGGAFADEGARMIGEAYSQLSEEPSVIDSFGWLKYKQGRFEDSPLPDGTSTPGAVSLLGSAVNNTTKPASAEQTDHYGDALWRAGRKLEAKTQWEAAKRLLDSQLSMARASRPAGTPPRAQEQKVQAHSEAIDAKLKAADAGKPPPVAPTLAETAKSVSPGR